MSCCVGVLVCWCVDALAVLPQELRANGAVRLNHKKLNKLLGFCERHGDTVVGLEFLKVRTPSTAFGWSRSMEEGCMDIGPSFDNMVETRLTCCKPHP